MWAFDWNDAYAGELRLPLYLTPTDASTRTRFEFLAVDSGGAATELVSDEMMRQRDRTTSLDDDYSSISEYELTYGSSRKLKRGMNDGSRLREFLSSQRDVHYSFHTLNSVIVFISIDV